MDPLTMFIPLAKADAAQRLVFGSFDETPDRAGEVCDYATAKPAFEAWSAALEKASNGKSLGNIRGQHSNIAAGKLVEITFDDMAKSIGFCAKIVDDNEWQKVEEGVYTGFSPGGKYAKRWQDGAHKRYTPDVRELSIVDVPCNPSATFTMVKSDGAEEQVEFTLDKAYEPGNDATRDRAETLAKAAGGDAKAKDFVVKARADLIAENADAALAKMAVEIEPKADLVAALDAALAKADAVAKTVIVIDGADDLSKRGAAIQLLAKSIEDQPVLAKGLYTLECVGRLMERVGCIANDVAWEEKAENDTDSKLPQMAIELVGKVRDLLIEMANEETAELLASINANLPEFDLVIIDGDDMELASQIVDLVKADTSLMEKAGARNSKADQAKIQTMHDHSVSLGADCGGPVKKDALAEIEADRDRLAKAMEASVPRVEALAARVEEVLAKAAASEGELAKALGRIAELEKQPATPKGVIRALEKGEEGGPLSDEKTEPLTGDALVRDARRVANRIR